MPVENEFNYVLDDADGSLRGRLARKAGVRTREIVQAYLTDENRIRSFHDSEKGETTYVFSFKRKVEGKVREIETPLSKEDFDALLPTATRTLRKTRYAFEEAGAHWDVDYFEGRKGTYFVKAEAEVADSIRVAPAPCETIAANVLYEAGKQSGFSSRRLADEAYARDLMRIVRQHAKRRDARLRKGKDVDAYLTLAA